MHQKTRHKAHTVYVGLSGGVDSSVAALLLREQGYKVTGVYMKNWSQDLPGMPCPWRDDYQDAKRVAVQLGIDFKMYDFEKVYRHRVVEHMIEQYRAGRTPNPDIMCNQEIKFKLFLETALKDGADYIATGHYARVFYTLSSQLSAKSSRLGGVRLLMAHDASKDQTYFLYRITRKALARTLFPLGELTKSEVRTLAKEHNLVTADKKESMGICFVGKVGIKDFLSQFVKTKPGKVVNQQGRIIGEHDGAIFYTIGQRHGLDVGGGLPYYVVGKDMKKNEVYVTTDLQDEKLWSREIKLTDIHWINKPPVRSRELRISNSEDKPSSLSVRMRHRAKLIPVKILDLLSNTQARVELDEEVKALTPGQSAVFYSAEECLGGGIVI